MNAAHAAHHKSHRLLSVVVLFSLVLGMVLGVLEPAQAAAPAAAPQTPIVADAEALLSIVNVGAPAINGIFDADSTITVSDLADHFVPPAAVGDAFLQSRTWPVGEAGTVGAGLYAFLYRIDLRAATGLTAIACVTTMTIDFGPVTPLDYNKDGKLDQVFVVTAGGLGTVAPVIASQTGSVITFRFDPAICDGSRPGGGQSSFFFGLASTQPERIITANLTGSAGLNETLKAKAPRRRTTTEPGCFEIKSPTEIPSPALVDFDDLPDAAVIKDHYLPTDGLDFYAGKDTEVITYADRDADPTKARSAPNVATNNAIFPTTSENIPLTFSFTSGKTHVGFYMGNGESAGLAGAMVGYDAAGNVICQITNTPVPEKYEEFIGMYDPAGRIVTVTLNYGASLLSESIDDLYYAPGFSGALAAPTGPLFGDARGGPNVKVFDADNKGLKATFTLPEPQFLPVKAPDQRNYIHFVMPGIDPNTSSDPGLPEVPVFRTMIAVPPGASVRLPAVQIDEAAILIGLLLPAQPSPADAPAAQEPGDEMPDPKDFMDLPFTRNDEAYRSDKPWPPQPVEVKRMGMVRDLEIWQVSVAAGRYIPATGEILPYKSLTVEFAFEGGKEGFLPSGRQDNPFDGNRNPLYEGDGLDGMNPLYSTVINRAVLLRYPYEFPIVVQPLCWGNEFLIITDPAFRPAADTLRNWKVSKGISTLVVETGNDPGDAGTTNAAIKAYIKNRYDTCLTRPSYVLMLGDAEQIPPFYRTTTYGDSAGTDLDYSLMSGADILPDLAYGRIPVDTLNQANTVINKIVAYEDTPPVNADFYDTAAMASYFQCCRPDVVNDGTDSRSFLETSELIRNHLLGQGYAVERIYDTSTAYHNDPGEASYYNAATRSTVPNRYYNNALLPADLRAGSGFVWDGNSADVVDAFNDGRFLIMHRDHGGINGWGDPGFGTGNIAAVNNGALLPVVYSVNCASGLWDNETRNPANDYYTYNTNMAGVYWAESLLRQDDGAIGVIGDTRNSPTWANSALARGLFDATWPGLVPAFGGAGSIKRLGDILNHAKLYMAGQVGVAQTAGSVTASQSNTNIILYHVLGDPTLQMWTSNPHQIFLPPWIKYIEVKPNWWRIGYPVEGAVITALQDGEPVARGRVVNGSAILVALGDGSVRNEKRPLTFSAAMPDGQSTPLARRTLTAPFVPASGGSITDGAAGFKFDLPAGAADENLTIVYSDGISGTAPLPAPLTSLNFVEVAAFKGDGSVMDQFNKPWTMTFQLDQAGAAGATEVNAGSLSCMYLDEQSNKWLAIPTTVDAAGDKVTCSSTHLTEFALVSGLQAGPSIFLPVVGN